MKTDSWCEVSPMGELLVRSAQLYPDRDAVIFPEQKKTYAELYQGAARMARGLTALGIKSGNHVGLLSLNSIEFIEALFGIALIGAVSVPMNARHKARELGYIIDHAQMSVVLTTGSGNDYVNFADLLQQALPELSHTAKPAELAISAAKMLRAVVLLNGDGSRGLLSRKAFDALADTVAEQEIEQLRHRVRVRDVATIIYTSGTTANPKGCMLSHEAMTRGAVSRARGRLSVGDLNVTWGAGPLFHIGTLAPFLGSVGASATYLTDEYFEPGRALQLMMTHGVTAAWPWFPAIIQSLLDHPTFDAGKLQSMKSMLLIAAPSLVARVRKLFPDTELNQACGMTETAGIFAISAPDESDESRFKTQGKAVPGVEVKIIDTETGQEAALGSSGELLVRGYCVMESYYRDEVKTREALDAERWLKTGDLYIKTADDSLIFNGRVKDMLKVGGENVAAIEIESYVAAHEAVKICEVVGRPDERLDEVPVAFVELRDGKSATAEQIIDFCKGAIASYKVPRAVHFVTAEQWPMSATKVNKVALRERLKTLN